MVALTDMASLQHGLLSSTEHASPPSQQQQQQDSQGEAESDLSHGRGRRNSLSNPLPYNPDLLDVFNFHGALRPRRPSFSGTLSLGGIDLIPPSSMSEGDSILNLESQFCKDFECCGNQFPSLHELLAHYETAHVHVKDFGGSELLPGTHTTGPYGGLVGVGKLEPIREEDSDSSSGGASSVMMKIDESTGSLSTSTSPSPAPASCTSDAFPSPAPSHGSLSTIVDGGVGHIQEGIRHLHLDHDPYFSQYTRVANLHQQHLEHQQGVFLTPAAKRARAPSLVAANPPDDSKKVRGMAQYTDMDKASSTANSVNPSAGSLVDGANSSVDSKNAPLHDYVNGIHMPVTPPMEFSAQSIHSRQGQSEQTSTHQHPQNSPPMQHISPHMSPALLHAQLQYDPSQQQGTHHQAMSPHVAFLESAAAQHHTHSPIPQSPQPNLPPHIRTFIRQNSPGPGQMTYRASTPGMLPPEHPHFSVPTPPPRPSSTPAMLPVGIYPVQGPPGYVDSDGGSPGILDDFGGVSGQGGSKRYKCPKPFCSKVYKNSNGLKYHLEHGNCELDYASADMDGRIAPAQPQEAMSYHAPTGYPYYSLPLMGYSMNMQMVNGLPMTDIKIALRPYWCRVPGCGKKYKNLNGLKYHAKVTHPDMDFKNEVKGHTSMSL
ncbi:uncharacterized protein SPPG_06817 [Spizellomyces punctatus DAOM BR117]|uniref:C2H2-type domain-containing protein n=1 Tax=Spizellomyces punctatus (strain DAOM BR117) TaxID=645134 RepID=A0A0L0H9Y3_SPIPD|nr:uncharacterized protein SPPG_06817 [Spizellomyces punctatus DAOM BR117]KNC97821.1 hypothetical protein SPPG_06817 [Spizellomyces punctatus DAOM BR117]|eukprot:XP_016605861.1 hypothetical protein SPPG_06817 [Spizellomyces punctatus DAOM BR117]